MRILPIRNNFNIFKNNKNIVTQNTSNVTNSTNAITFSGGITYDPNYNQVALELVEDSNRYAYHSNNVDERKYILSKYSDTPNLYKHLAFNKNVRYYGLERGSWNDDCCSPKWKEYSAIEHVVHEGDLTGTYLLFENAPNQEIKDKLATTLLNSYLSYLENDVDYPVFIHDEAYKHKEIKEFKDNPFVVLAALRHMSDECKDNNIDKIKKIFYGINYNAGTLKSYDEIDKSQDFIKAGYEILNEMSADTAKDMIKFLSENIPYARNQIRYFDKNADIRQEYKQYLDLIE